MMNKLLIVLIVTTIIISAGTVYSQSMQGKITDATDSEPVIGAVIKVKGTTTGTLSDLDGTYKLDELTPGNYDLEIYYIGYNSKLIKSVKVLSGEVTKLGIRCNSFKRTIAFIRTKKFRKDTGRN
ncbi:MAG: carboxypeptidase-like regulatory domain-containing protein [Ignavibacteria bacterium]|nr:carboxypeptidase-like regulatory domain-containing protein [Ignavibacteria bacterium]